MIISTNKKISYDYFIIEKFEAGIILQGWEVKSIRSRKVQINDAHIIIRNFKPLLVNSHISPLLSACTHKETDATRTRELLLNKKEISKLIGHVERKGLTIVPVNLYINKNGFVKLGIALSKGKKNYDKRATEKDREWNKEKSRLMKNNFL